jgi:predicted RNA binding protein YcfA (HicA-like mRNA interferase family)
MKPITGKELCRRLEEAGWTLKRVKGSHHIYAKPGEWKIISVLAHNGQMIKPGLAGRIAKDFGISW